MTDQAREREHEQGFLLLGLIVAIFIILLMLSVAAPKMARELRREREVETVHRGNQYVRAIQLYYRKFGHYPGSMEQLDKTNLVRFLRQDYVDPMTGKADWRIIKVGENKTTVKGFFGKPLAGLPAAGGLGSAGGSAGGSAFGSAGTAPAAASGSAFGNSGSGGFSLGPSSPGSGTGSSGSNTAGYGASGSASSSGGSQSASGSDALSGGSGPFVGVGLAKDGDSIITLNEQTTYNTWEFIYDPRIEMLKAKGAMLGGGASGLGTSSGSGSSSFGGSNSMGFGNSSSPASNGSATPPPTTNPNPQ